MRPDLPPAIAERIERCERPSLVFDLARVEANLRAIVAAARAVHATTLFAVKSFPHPAVRALALQLVDGFDVASPAEATAVAGARVVSIADPSGRTNGVAAARVIISCETSAQVAASPPGAEIAIRLSASSGGRDPAIGAILDGSGHRRSRFGLDVDPDRRRAAIAAMVSVAAGRPVGIHLHHGPVTATSSERFVATARAALASAREAELEPTFINLGGAWHGLPESELGAALAAIRAVVPASIELVIEPGRVVSRGAGFACGKVASTRALDDRMLHVTELSRICHLRWSQIELVAPAPAAGNGVNAVFVGPTCYEEDILGEWIVAPHTFELGARVVLRDVTGYALAWNTGFGGVPPADVIT